VDAPLWLFAVADDEGKIVLSVERNQGIDMAFFDPENSDGRVIRLMSWRVTRLGISRKSC